MKKIDYKQVVKVLKNKDKKEKENALNQAKESNILLEKCVLLRAYTSPQSADAEKIIKNDLDIKNSLDKTSGDGIKNDVKYEIKVSLHDENSNVNIRQIRPHHKIDYYIIVSLNLYEGEDGEAYIFKIPKNIIHKLIVEFGGYTHGTKIKNGKITMSSLRKNNNLKEYSLTANPNATEGTKSKRLWNEFLEYRVDYKEKEF